MFLHIFSRRFLVCRCRSRCGSVPSIVSTASTAASIDKHQQPVTSSELSLASGVTTVTASTSRPTDTPVSCDATAVSPRPSLALRHLIRASAPPSHVTVRTAPGSTRPARFLHLATIPASVATGDARCHVPVPPPTGSPTTASVQPRPTRTSSAQRFRNMVLECRDGD